MKKAISLTLVFVMLVSVLFSGCGINKDKMKLSNENANEKTVKIYQYICSVYGEKLLTGQQESTWMDSPDYEMDYIENATGKLPAVRGLDFMNDDFDGVVERAIEWDKNGGIVTICWHCGPDFSGNYDNCKDDEIKNWDAVLTSGTPENKAFIENMDKAGKALKELEKAGVTVLWRPFHEFDGAWFWWGKGGSENFKKLWIMMYDHFTNDLELNNLIWVLGFSHNGNDYDEKIKNWYPGDEYCDVLGADTYEVAENGPEKRLYKPVYNLAKGKKPIIMHECGQIPTVEQFESVPWAMFMTWHTEWLIDTNTKESLKEIYNSDYVITLDEVKY